MLDCRSDLQLPTFRRGPGRADAGSAIDPRMFLAMCAIMSTGSRPNPELGGRPKVGRQWISFPHPDSVGAEFAS